MSLDCFTRLEIAISAISPVEIGLAYCQKKHGSFLGEGGFRTISIICTPLDYLIQVAVTPIWMIYDDLQHHSTLLDRTLIPIRLPFKILLGIISSLITQCVENINRIKTIYHCTSDEVYHIYRGRWSWLTSCQKAAEDFSDIEVIANCHLHEKVKENIEKNVLPSLKEKNYTHLYIMSQREIAPPYLFTPDGPFCDRLITNQGRSTFIFLLLSHWDENARKDWTTEKIKQLHNGAAEDMTDERTVMTLGKIEYFNLLRYNILPLHIINKIKKLPPFV